MAILTKYRLAEQAFNLIEGGDPATASSISINELKIACGQVINALIKADYVSVNIGGNEMIPNGGVLGVYENIAVEKWGNLSRALLPIKPLKLPRDIGVFSVYPSGKPDQEFIPLQLGQSSLIKSQAMINDILGQVGRETQGGYVVFTKNLTGLVEGITVDMKLVVMDINQYDDYDLLPVPPELEWEIITQVYKMYSTQPIPDKIVSPTSKEEKGIPTNQQKQG